MINLPIFEPFTIPELALSFVDWRDDLLVPEQVKESREGLALHLQTEVINVERPTVILCGTGGPKDGCDEKLPQVTFAVFDKREIIGAFNFYNMAMLPASTRTHSSFAAMPTPGCAGAGELSPRKTWGRIMAYFLENDLALRDTNTRISIDEFRFPQLEGHEWNGRGEEIILFARGPERSYTLERSHADNPATLKRGSR